VAQNAAISRNSVCDTKTKMRLSFDEAKATQSAAAFLRLAGGCLNYMALIKLLYMADREALRRWGMPITTDRYVSMQFGPVTSTIYDRIKASANPAASLTLWSAHIKTNGFDAHLEADPGLSEMSRAENSLISEVFRDHGMKDRFQLADECHKEFPEWASPGTGSAPIEIEEIAVALGLPEDEARAIDVRIEAQRASRLLAA
jgi:uncharacterized phage-associated protein